MADTGLTLDGFVPELTPDIRDGVEEDIRISFGRSLPLGDRTLLGHLLGIISERLGSNWEVLEQVVSAFDPDKSTGVYLEQLSLITGTVKQVATSSTCPEIFAGVPGTVIAAGKIIATASTGVQFTSQADVTLVAQAAWVPSTNYLVFARVTNASRVYQCITAGLSAGSGGPTTTADDILDGTVHWQYVGDGTGLADATTASVDTGPVFAAAGDLTSIQTPVAGWSTAKNVVDATLGLLDDTDESLRVRREQELAGNGASTKDATRAALLKLTGVISCSVFTNRGDVTDGNGLPPHSFEVLINGGDPQTIVDTIANEQPDGIATYGSSSGNHTDSEGVTEVVNYSRPTQILMYLYLVVTYDVALYPRDGDSGVKQAIATFGQGYVTDSDVDPTAIASPAFTIAGVRGCTALVYDDVIAAPVAWAALTPYSATPGTRSVVTNDGGRAYICTVSGTSAGSGGPTGVGTDIVDGGAHWYYLGNVYSIALRELASFSTTRMTVSSSAVTP